MINIKVGDHVKVIKLNERHFHCIGEVIKVVNTNKKQMYIVEFKDKWNEYYEEKDIAYLF
jgi:hypothetical protein